MREWREELTMVGEGGEEGSEECGGGQRWRWRLRGGRKWGEIGGGG